MTVPCRAQVVTANVAPVTPSTNGYRIEMGW